MAAKTSSKGSYGSGRAAGAGRAGAGKPETLPDVALAAVISAKKEKDVGEFLDFFVSALERNTDWMNGVVEKQNSFKCALMVGAGPNSYQVQEVIYPATDDRNVKLEVELRDSDDYDKVAIAALLKISTHDMNEALEFVKSRLYQNSILRDDLLKGKSMGVSYVLLKPISEKKYRVVEHIHIDSSKALNPKKTQDIKSPILKRFRRF